jgi:hypothetical protein
VPRLLVSLSIVLALCTLPAQAERPIADFHHFDPYFSLFAGDSNVPWKPTTVRLDTYTSAPVRFAVYQADPADVLTAGSNARPRAIDTRGRRPIASFTFTPPGGYQFQSNEVAVPLGSREGFFVVEARRGDVGEQVWINRTRVGLVSKETPNELLLYGTDLGTGRALARMRVQFVVNRHFVTLFTDEHGLIRWTRSPRPIFALAQWGASYAFLSLLPQPPLPPAIVGVRTDSAVVHAGDTVRIAGFARTREGSVLRPASGSVDVTMRHGASIVGEQRVRLDDDGAFTATFAVPPTAAAGDYAILAQAAGGIGSATVHVDADAGALSLDVSAECGDRCDPSADVPLRVHSSHGGVDVHVTVIRSPHVYVGYTPKTTPWGTTVWLDRTVRTDGSGNVTVMIPHPADELASTYGVRVESGGATAVTRIVVPTARAAVRIQPDRQEQTIGAPLGFAVYAADVRTGKPLAGRTVSVQLVHGTTVQQQRLTLDASGSARGTFSSPQLGTDLIFATLDDGGRAMDASQVQVDSQTALATTQGGSTAVRIELDRHIYRSGDPVGVDAFAPGAQGDALLTLESASGVEPAVVATADAHARATFRAGDAIGELGVGAAFVHDGAIEWTTAPLELVAPGRPRRAALAPAGAAFAAGTLASIAVPGAPAGTAVVRLSRGTPSGSAAFDAALSLLAIGATTTQNSAPAGVTWHPWVDSTGNHAQMLGFVRRTQPPQELSLPQAETQAVSWSVAPLRDGTIAVQMPAQSGRYTLSLLDIAADGSVVAARRDVIVR